MIKIIKTILYSSLSIVMLQACVDKDEIASYAQINFVPLAPDMNPVDFMIGDNKVATQVGYSSTVGTTRYTLPYFITEPGQKNIRFTLPGTTNNISSVSKYIEDNQAYSAFLIDSNQFVKTAIVNDNVLDPTPGKVKLRFFHFSPNAPAMDVFITETNSTLFTNRSFNDQANNTSLAQFIEVPPGNYTMQLRTVGTTTVLATIATQNLLPDRIYTIAARGNVGGATFKALSGWVYNNKN